MGRRRKQQLEEENHERWLVSYADFITLLFAFFVVMYAISSVNEGKYRVLSDSLNAVFKETGGPSQQVEIGEPVRDIVSAPEDFPLSRSSDSDKRPLVEADPDQPVTDAGEAFRGSLQRINDEIEISMRPFIDQQLIDVANNGDRVEIELNAQLLFQSGEARLSMPALDVLRDLSRTLETIPNRIQVEGHTDNIPIATSAYPSNWELSAARAASVVHYFSRLGIEPGRLAAVGLGQHQPRESNDSAKGRARNRRVVLVVLGEDPPDYVVPWAEGPSVEQR